MLFALRLVLFPLCFFVLSTIPAFVFGVLFESPACSESAETVPSHPGCSVSAWLSSRSGDPTFEYDLFVFVSSFEFLLRSDILCARRFALHVASIYLALFKFTSTCSMVNVSLMCAFCRHHVLFCSECGFDRSSAFSCLLGCSFDKLFLPSWLCFYVSTAYTRSDCLFLSFSVRLNLGGAV